MTRQEIIDLMPIPPGLDWDKVQIGHTLLQIPVNLAYNPNWEFSFVMLTETHEYDPGVFWGDEVWVASGGGETRRRSKEPYGSEYLDIETGWNLTLLSREHKLPTEIVQLAMEMLYDQR